jgi:hypothetical protein
MSIREDEQGLYADPLLTKWPHPTMTREEGPLHRPRFPDAREDDRETGGGA